MLLGGRTYPQTVKIEVTAEDIKNGKTSNSSCCPVALAAGRAFPGVRVAVGRGCINLYGAGEGWEPLLVGYALPSVALDFVLKFDAFGIGSPLTFEAVKNF